MEDKTLEARANAARELLAKLGMKTPALWEMRAVVAAIREAEERGATREREALIELFKGGAYTHARGEESGGQPK